MPLIIHVTSHAYLSPLSFNEQSPLEYILYTVVYSPSSSSFLNLVCISFTMRIIIFLLFSLCHIIAKHSIASYNCQCKRNNRYNKCSYRRNVFNKPFAVTNYFGTCSVKLFIMMYFLAFLSRVSIPSFRLYRSFMYFCSEFSYCITTIWACCLIISNICPTVTAYHNYPLLSIIVLCLL